MKEKIKYYDKEITEQENRIMANIIILATVIICLMLGYMLGSMDRNGQIKKLQLEKYEQYVEIESLKETIERGK